MSSLRQHRQAVSSPAAARQVRVAGTRRQAGKSNASLEPVYLEPGPKNRMVLALRSGLPDQIDWALARLIHVSYHYPERFLFDHFLDLSETLLSFPRRVCAAISGEPEEAWASRFFEQQQEDDGGDEVPQTTAHRQKRFKQSPGDVVRLAPLAHAVNERVIPGSQRHSTFDPAHVKSHGDLLRRALEASLIIRNATMVASNARHLISHGGMFSLTRSVFDLPDVGLGRSSAHQKAHAQAVALGADPASQSSDDGPAGRIVAATPAAPSVAPRSLEDEIEAEEWLELEGVAELRNYYLDILEGLAPKMHLNQRALFAVTLDGGVCELSAAAPMPTIAEGLVSSRSSNKKLVLRPQDSIFVRLLHYVHHSSDRHLVLGALRVLSVLAASGRNEAAFVEVDIDEDTLRLHKEALAGTSSSAPRPNSSGRTSPVVAVSPGLMRRCVELLPLTEDKALAEATLDLLQQLVGIGNNAFRLCALAPNLVAASSGASEQNGSSADLLIQSRVSATTHWIVRLLASNLNDSAEVKLRERRLARHPATPFVIPSVQKLRIREENERSARMEQVEQGGPHLSDVQLRELRAMPEPQRVDSWIALVCRKSDNLNEAIEQSPLWSAYFRTFATPGCAPLMQADRFYRHLMDTIEGCYPKPHLGRFLVFGLQWRQGSFAEHGCGWSTCPAPETGSAEKLQKHLETHVAYAPDGRCRWRACKHLSSGPDTKTMRANMLAHVRTHVEAVPPLTLLKGPPDEDNDQPLLPLTLSGGSRVLSRPGHSLLGPDMASLYRGRDGSLVQPPSWAEIQLGARRAADPGTFDDPGFVRYEDFRTPVDANEVFIGLAGPSAFTLRTLVRASATVLDRAGLRPPLETLVARGLLSDKFSSSTTLAAAAAASTAAAASASKRFEGPLGEEEMSERFGFPEPPPDQDQTGADPGFGENAGSAGGPGSGARGMEAWLVQAAQTLMDALVAVEPEVSAVVAHNDNLGPHLAPWLRQLRPEAAPSLLAEDLDPAILG